MAAHYASEDAGTSWARRQDGLRAAGTLNSIFLDRAAPSIVYAATSNGVLRSPNGGLTWDPVFDVAGVNRISSNNTGKKLYAATDAGVFEFEPDPLGFKNTVVEFYNADLDHHFITTDRKEIADLDTGLHAGWQRTGQTFTAYSRAMPQADPVCRFYIPPAFGDSHFYSASPLECGQVQARFPELQFESADVFWIDLPETKTGNCPVSDRPVYRIWNNRSDSNHRYTVDSTVRDLLAALGGIPEGYGPDVATMCSPQ